MINTGHICQDLEQGAVLIRALRSLPRQNVDTVTQAVVTLGRGWSVQSHDDYDGYLSILVEPLDAITEQPTYLISGTVNQIELARLCDDELSALGAFDNLHAAVEQLLRVPRN